MINKLIYLLIRSTGKPNEIEEIGNNIIEKYYFNFGYFMLTTEISFNKTKKAN